MIISLNLNQADFPSSKKKPQEEKVDHNIIIFLTNKDESVHSVQNMFLKMQWKEV